MTIVNYRISICVLDVVAAAAVVALDASASYAQSAPAAEMAVSFTAEVEKQLLTLEKRYPQLTLFIREVLAQDPRPAYRKGEETGKTYAVWLHDFNVRWRVTDAGFEVFALEPR